MENLHGIHKSTNSDSYKPPSNENELKLQRLCKAFRMLRYAARDQCGKSISYNRTLEKVKNETKTSEFLDDKASPKKGNEKF